AWPVDRYASRVSDLRTFLESRYGQPTAIPPDKRISSGYTWSRGDTTVSTFCQTDRAPAGKPISVSTLFIRYRGRHYAAPIDESASPAIWKETVLSPVVSPKVSSSTDLPPDGSDLGITSASLLNTSDSNQNAFVLQ